MGSGRQGWSANRPGVGHNLVRKEPELHELLVALGPPDCCPLGTYLVHVALRTMSWLSMGGLRVTGRRVPCRAIPHMQSDSARPTVTGDDALPIPTDHFSQAIPCRQQFGPPRPCPSAGGPPKAIFLDGRRLAMRPCAMAARSLLRGSHAPSAPQCDFKKEESNHDAEAATPTRVTTKRQSLPRRVGGSRRCPPGSAALLARTRCRAGDAGRCKHKKGRRLPPLPESLGGSQLPWGSFGETAPST